MKKPIVEKTVREILMDGEIFFTQNDIESIGRICAIAYKGKHHEKPKTRKIKESGKTIVVNTYPITFEKNIQRIICNYYMRSLK